MDSPNSLLLGFIPSYHTLTVNGTLNRRWVAGNTTNGLATKTEKKKSFLFLFSINCFLRLCTTDKRWDLSPSTCSQIHQYTYVLVFDVCCAEVRDIPTSSRILVLWENVFHWKVFSLEVRIHFHWQQRVRKELPSGEKNSLLVFEIQQHYCFPKTMYFFLFPLVHFLTSEDTSSTLASDHWYLSVLVVLIIRA